KKRLKKRCQAALVRPLKSGWNVASPARMGLRRSWLATVSATRDILMPRAFRAAPSEWMSEKLPAADIFESRRRSDYLRYLVVMSGGKADIASTSQNVRYGPKYRSLQFTRNWLPRYNKGMNVQTSAGQSAA